MRGWLWSAIVTGLVGCGTVTPEVIDAHPDASSVDDAGPDAANLDAAAADAAPCTPALVGVCGRNANGIDCATVGANRSFASVTRWSTDFSNVNGWQATMSTWGTIMFPDVTGDGRADVCGRSSAGIECAVAAGTAFQPRSRWISEFSDSAGWGDTPSHWATIQFPDINGDGRADVCGRATSGAFCAVSNGVDGFGAPGTWGHQFTNLGGWAASPSYWGSIQYPDLDGDGRADVCGRASDGLYCGRSDGTRFATETRWLASFTDAAGWTQAAQWSTIQYADLDGDGRDDVCGRGPSGVACALSNGTSSFGAVGLWETTFTDASGWTTPSDFATIQFPDLDGDGRADICGRRADGVACGLSNGTRFLTTTLWSSIYTDAAGWDGAQRYWGTIQFPDLDGDGRADVCGRSSTIVQCALSTGTSFGTPFTMLADFTDAGGWAEDANWSTLAFGVLARGTCTPSPAVAAPRRLVQRGFTF